MKGLELLASCWTTAGAVKPLSDDERSPEHFADRVEAAIKTGFVGVGFGYADIVAIRDSIGFSKMRSVLRQYNMKYLELEMLMGWYAAGAERDAANLARDTLLEAAAELDAMHIKAGTSYSSERFPLDKLAADFHDLCKRAADANTAIALEPQPMATIKTPQQALRLAVRTEELAPPARREV